MDERRSAERLIILLGDLMERMIAVDSKPMDFETGSVLHRAEIHTIQAIGRNPGINLTRLAEQMGVTKGAASQMVSRLVRKGLVRKAPAPEARREIVLQLTERGWRGYAAHERLHERMFEAIRAHYGAGGDRRVRAAARAVEDLIALVTIYERMSGR